MLFLKGSFYFFLTGLFMKTITVIFHVCRCGWGQKVVKNHYFINKVVFCGKMW